MSEPTRIPPSLNMAREAGGPDEAAAQWERRQRSNASIERVEERKKKVRARQASVEKAMRNLPLRAGAERDIPGLGSAFESTSHAIKRKAKRTPASEQQIENELKKFSRLSNGLARHIESMQSDAIVACAAAGSPIVKANTDVVTAIVWRLPDIAPTLMSAAGLADRALEAAKRAKRVGRKKDAMAAGLREAAELAFVMLTKRKAGRIYDAARDFKEKESEFAQFLDAIYKAYGLNVSAMSRSRKPRKPRPRRPSMGKN